MKLAKVILAIFGIGAPMMVAQQMPAQQPGTPQGVVQGSGPTVRTGFGGGADSQPLSRDSQERLEKGRMSERQKRLVSDTDRLLTLATQLKAEMDKTTKDTLSIDVIKKAEEIEKLAKSVKDRMKG